MFSRYNNNNNNTYSNLGPLTRKNESDAKLNGNTGRRAFGQDITNARSGNINVNAGKSRTNAGTEKPRQYRVPKIQQTSQQQQQQKIAQRKPLVPVNQNTSQPKQSTGKVVLQGNANSKSYQFTGIVDNIDVRSVEDPLAVTDYVEDMYEHFRNKEGEAVVLPVYMEMTQSHINDRMRAILVDWLVEVHMKFKLVPETLFLTVNLIDRYLERKEVTRSNLQLLGVSSLLVATKYEEIYPPSVEELVYICDNAYTRSNIIKMETQILKTLEYQITHPSAHTFLVRFLKAGHENKEMSQMASYLLDGTLQSYSMLNYKPSELAAAAVFLARQVYGRHPWSPTLRVYSRYLEEDVVPVARALLEAKSAAIPDLHSVNKKYSSSRYGNVANKPLTVDF